MERKNKSTAGLLALFLGAFGAHRFYLRQPGLGLLYLFFFWTTIPLWAAFIDMIIFFSMSEMEFNTKYNPALMAIAAEKRKSAQAPKATAEDWTDKLTKLHGLLEKGIISQEEFEERKRDIMGN